MDDEMKQEPHQSGENRPTPTRKRLYKVPRLFVYSLVLLCGMAVIAFVVYTSRDMPPMDEIENPQSHLSSQLISADGVILQNYFSSENRVNITLNEISPYVVDALIATEDRRFYNHSGIDLISIPAIALRKIRGVTSGGSTITMQLARNLFNAVGKEKTFDRKIREMIVAAIIERKFTKEEILTAYLNTVNIYGQSFGIEMAAQQLFDKSAKDLNLEESATLVAMLKGSGIFNPYRNPERVQVRRNHVINQLVKYHFIDPETVNADSIKQLPVVVQTRGEEHLRGIAPYFREHVRQFLNSWCKDHGYSLYEDGLRVYTTLDTRLQAHAEAAVQTHLTELQAEFEDHLKGKEPYRRDTSILTVLLRQSERYRLARKAQKSEQEIWKEFHNPVPMRIFHWEGDIDTVMKPIDSVKYYAKILETGMVSIDPRNGHVKAWVGGNNYRHFKYDHAGLGKRQVGSTFKPFVYAAAFEYAGKSPCDLELNQPVFFDPIKEGEPPWSPQNSDESYGGMITLRRGLAGSVNHITARLMKQVGPRMVARYAYQMGIQSPLEEVPSLCLGTTDLSVLELTSAYGTFANRGLWIEPRLISRIEDQNGNVLATFPGKTKQGISEYNSYLMIDLLKGVVDAGTARRLRSRFEFTNEIAAKTGTTQEHSDGWFVGITPNLVSGVWVGCSDRRMHFNTLELGMGANTALPVWGHYMKSVYADSLLNIEPLPFKAPRGFDHSLLDCSDLIVADSLMRSAAPEKARKAWDGENLEGFD